MKRWIGTASLLALLFALGTSLASAQTVRPGDVRDELPPPAADESGTDLELPPIPEEDDARLGSGVAVAVRRFDVLGATAFPPEAYRRALAPWLDRTIQSEQLLAARDAITTLYRDAGYMTSGAIVPDQEVEDGVVTILVVEGRLTEVDVRGVDAFRSAYFSRRLANVSTPLDVGEVQEVLRRFQRDRWVDRIDARLEPGAGLGESRLVLVVDEALPWHARFAAGNDRARAIGSAGFATELVVANVFGERDVWTGRFDVSDGLRDVEVRFEVPITPLDTRFGVRYRDTRTQIVESPFDAWDIEADSQSVGVSLQQPVYREGAHEIWLELMGDWRQTRSKVFGNAFCFEFTGPDCERPTVAVYRNALHWTWRALDSVAAVRTQVSFGLDALGASIGATDGGADGRFVSWLTQAQWIRVLPESWRGTQVVLRADLQLSNDPLFSIEKFALGGRRTVRGYRENQVVRDAGYAASAELRVPLWRDSLRRHLLEFVPFMDYGQGWNVGDGRARETLWSLGAGLRFTPWRGVLAEAYWGGRLARVFEAGDSLQDEGVHLRIQIDAPDLFF